MFNIFNRKKYCLVLGGGGLKGAYQIGVWKALREQHIKLEAIIGTSIGAINGSFIAVSDFKKVETGWLTLSPTRVFNIDSDTTNRFSVFREMTKQIMELGGLDTSPLRDFISGLINETKLRKSKIDFGIVTFRVNDLKPIQCFLEDIPEGELLDYIMASSSLPGFKPTNINGKRFADGGFYDVVPYNTARQRGYKNIIAVDISGVGIDRKDQTEGGVTVFIKNSLDTSGILDFSQKSIQRNIRMGYLDTRKAFGLLDSIDYFFKADKKIDRKFKKLLSDEKIKQTIIKYIDYAKQTDKNSSIVNQIREILPAEIKLHKNILIPLVECAAEMLQIDRLQFDNLKDLLNEIRNRKKEISERKITIDTNKFFDKIKMLSGMINSAVFNSKDLIKYMTEYESSLGYLKIIHSFYPKLTATLILLSLIDLI